MAIQSEMNINCIELINAMSENRSADVEKWLKEGAPINVEIELDGSCEILTPLTFAAKTNNSEICRIVLNRAKSENMSYEDLYLRTAMRNACKTNCCKSAKNLSGEEVSYENIYETGKEQQHTQEDKHKYTDPEANFLHICAFYGSHEVLELLIDNQPNTDMNQKDSYGNTPLHLASHNGNTTCVILLLKKCPETKVNETNNKGDTPLSLAILNAKEELVNKLIRAGADVNIKNTKGRTPLHIAAEKGRDSLLHVLINKDTDINSKNEEDETPLMMACIAGNIACVKELLIRGAFIQAKEKAGRDTFTITRNKKQDEALSLVVRALRGSKDFEFLGWHEVIDQKLYKSTLTMLDCLIEPQMKENNVNLNFRVLEMDRENVTPGLEDDAEYKKSGRRSPYLLQRFAMCCNEELAYHGVTRILVNRKFKQFGNVLLWIKALWFLSFLVAMLYALVQAAQKHPTPQTLYQGSRTGWDVLRYISEIYVVLFWLGNIVTEFAEFTQVFLIARKFISDKKEEEGKCHTLRAKSKLVNNKYSILGNEYSFSSSGSCPQGRPVQMKRSLIETESKEPLRNEPCKIKKMKIELKKFNKSVLQKNIFVRVVLIYFHDWYNFLDLIGLLLIFILIIYRIIIIIDPYVRYLEFQWLFTTLAFAINAFRLTKFLNVSKIFGTYMRIIILILYKDVPKFLLLLLLTFILFSTTLYLSYRVPIIQNTNATNGDVAYYVTLFDLDELKQQGLDQYFYALLYPLRMLLEGNAFDFNYMFDSFNVVSATVYIIFLFLIIIVYLNLFIAQLSDTYAGVKANAEKAVAKFRLDYIVHTETTSLLALFIDFRKRFYEPTYSMEDGEWVKYFKASISRLDDDDFMTRELQENTYMLLNKAQKQQQVNNQNLQSEIESIKDTVKKILAKLENPPYGGNNSQSISHANSL